MPHIDFAGLGNLLVIYGVKAVIAIIIAVVGWTASGIVGRVTRRASMSTSHMDPTGDGAGAGRATEAALAPARHQGRDTEFQGLASSTILNGVAAARRKRVKPPWRQTSARRFSPACAPSAAPTSWLSDAGTQTLVEKA